MPPEPSGLPELHPAVIGEITAQLVDPLARRVVEVLHEQGLVQPRPKPKVWLDAAELAQQLGLTRAWVYQHASELGATRSETARDQGCDFHRRLSTRPRIQPARDELSDLERAHTMACCLSATTDRA